MSLSPDEKKQLLDCSLILQVDRLRRGHLRLKTPFHYPDGSHIDLFIKAQHDQLSPPSQIHLTDFGYTSSWLSNLNLDVTKSKRRERIVHRIQEMYGVTFSGGALEISIEDGKVTTGILNLAQACIRLADLSYTTRFANYGRFNEEVEEILSELDLDYETNQQIPGKFGKLVTVDFIVRSKARTSAIITLPSIKYASGARTQAEHTFVAFSDLIETYDGERIAALDDRSETYDATDLKRIETVATVVGVFNEANRLQSMLLAA